MADAITYEVSYTTRNNRVCKVYFNIRLGGRDISGVSVPVTKFTRAEWTVLANQPDGARYTVGGDSQYYIYCGDPMIVVVYGVASIHIPLSTATDKLREILTLEFDEDVYPPMAPPTK